MDRFGLTENERDDDTESRDVEKHAQFLSTAKSFP
jgi:hypothetical protein